MIYRRTLYKVDYILSPHEQIPNAGILIEDNNIVAVGGQSGFFSSADMLEIDLKEVYALPGFIDSHIHGTGGFESTSATKHRDQFPGMCQTLAAHGVTSFLPTVVSAPKAQIIDSIKTLVELSKEKFEGAEMVGIHLEGPFISPMKCGSQSSPDIIPIDLEFAQKLIDVGQGLIKIWTFAPELDGAIDFIKLLKANNIQPSMGHTSPTLEQVLAAIDAGANRVTHLYNGMPPLHQREVNLAAVALTDDRVSVDIILDGTHVNPRMVDLTCRTKPRHLIIAISDSIQGAGLEDGTYALGNNQIEIKAGQAFRGEYLAGTTQTLEVGWSRLVNYANLPQTDAACCFTHNPALAIGLNDRGALIPGKRADIVFCDKNTQEVVMTLVNGKVAFKRNE